MHERSQHREVRVDHNGFRKTLECDENEPPLKGDLPEYEEACHYGKADRMKNKTEQYCREENGQQPCLWKTWFRQHHFYTAATGVVMDREKRQGCRCEHNESAHLALESPDKFEFHCRAVEDYGGDEHEAENNGKEKGNKLDKPVPAIERKIAS